jgi:lysophospholipase L1-like esterase
MKKVFLFLLIASTVVLTAGKQKPIKIFLVGDSTMADKPTPDENPERGWGMVLPTFFKDNVIIENHAQNGRSTRSFIKEGRWDFLLDRIGKGDYVFIQFGHNDEVKTKKSYTTEEEFKANFERMVNDVRAKGAIPVICTSVARRSFDSIGNLIDTHPVYPEIIKQVAKEKDVYMIDMKARSEKVLRKYGVGDSKKLFMHIEPGIWKKVPEGKKDDTHFVALGAYEMANCAIEGIEDLKIKALVKNIKRHPSFGEIRYTTPVPGLSTIKPKEPTQ